MSSSQHGTPGPRRAVAVRGYNSVTMGSDIPPFPRMGASLAADEWSQVQVRVGASESRQ